MILDLHGAGHDFSRAASAQIVFENSVRIIEVTQDQIETAKITHQFVWQLRVLGEEAGERARFDRANGLSVESILGERGDVFVTEDLDPGSGIRVAQRLERRQHQNEIADRAAADYENPLQ